MIDLAIITASLAHDRVAGSIASLTGVAATEAGPASGLNNASFQIGGVVGVAILSTVACPAPTAPAPWRRSPMGTGPPSPQTTTSRKESQ
jgi:hypothetical protein